jgi:hypothetical protein
VSYLGSFPLSPKDPRQRGGERVFNDDLLANLNDSDYAEQQFPLLFPALKHDAMLDVFARHEGIANIAHKRVHRLGLFAVACGATALLSAATEPLWEHYPHHNLVAIVFEFAAICGAVIAGLGAFIGPWRKQWLESRFMTERLRHWHFQLLARRRREIHTLLAHVSPSTIANFRAERKKWFDAFMHEHEGRLDSCMTAFAEDIDFAEDWLHEATDFHRATNAQDVHELFNAYRRLRLKHQRDYAVYKLSTPEGQPLWRFLAWGLVQQRKVIETIVSCLLLFAFACSAGIIINRYFDLCPACNLYLGSATLVFAILGIAFRTIQDGLAIPREIERYRDYQTKCDRLLLYFDQTADSDTKVHVMELMELAAVDELRGFLRAHRDARFVL